MNGTMSYHAGTRGVSANSLRDSPWLKGPAFLRTHDWPFKPPKEVDIKLRAKESDTSEQELRYSSYEKLLCVVAYNLHLLPKNESYRSDSVLINNPNVMQNAQMRLFYLIQKESFLVDNSPPSATLPKFNNFPPSLVCNNNCKYFCYP